MKRTSLCVLMALLAASAFAQSAKAPAAGSMPRGDRPPAQAAQATVTISGTLVFVDNKPAIKTADGKTVFLEMPNFYYYAYTEGFKAGMPVTARGMQMEAPEDSPAAGQSFLMAEEVTIGGKTYVIVGGRMGMGSERKGPMGPRPEDSEPAAPAAGKH